MLIFLQNTKRQLWIFYTKGWSQFGDKWVRPEECLLKAFMVKRLTGAPGRTLLELLPKRI